MNEGQGQEQSVDAHKKYVRRRAGFRFVSTTDSGSVSEGSNPSPAPPQKPHFTGFFLSFVRYVPLDPVLSRPIKWYASGKEVVEIG
jgi:hypothetical protein